MYRERRGMTLQELGNKLGVTPATVSRWESGEIKSLKMEKISTLAQVLEVSTEDLFDDVGSTSTRYVSSQDKFTNLLISLVMSLPIEEQIELYNKLKARK